MTTLKTRGISLPPALLAAGEDRAHKQDQSFSGYVRRLMRNDLKAANGHESARTGNRKRSR